MEKRGCDASVFVSESNVYYISRFPRPMGSYVVIFKDGSSYLLTPLLDFSRARDIVRGTEVRPYAPYAVPDVEEELGIKLKDIKDTFKELLSNVKVICTDEPRRVKSLVTVKRIEDITDDIMELRSIKTAEEVSFMKKALQITEEALWRVLESLIPGLREYEVAGMLEGVMRYLGADGYAFETIVASGPNSAYPHAVPTSRELRQGDVVVIDLGAKYNGYSSDMTRTITMGSVPKEVKNALEVISEAVNNAIDVACDGVDARTVDSAARDTLKRYGLSKYFIHSTGHGVGIDVHEKPRLSQSSKEILREGMIVTIEPGIYIHGRYGIRIENMILIKKRKSEVLNKKPLIYTG